jgi:cysteine desulfurase/selenocysteine lyase
MLPWMQLRKKGVIVEFLDIDSNGKIIIDEEKLRGAKLLAITSLSNALGNLQDIKKICETAHNYGVPVLVDAAQSISHISLDVQNLDCDFLAFSGHKMFSVNGVGVLYGKKELLDQLQPLLYGGDMIADVSLHDFILAEAPRRFEGGTQDAAAVYALGKAIDYLHEIGMEEVDRYVRELSGYAVEKLAGIEGIEIYGGKEKHGIISFNLHGLHCHDVAEFLASRGIAVRSGHLCCKPLMRKLGVEGVVRISLHIYNDKGDIDSLINALKECKEFFT